MEHIFPPEIIDNSVEQHFSTYNRRSLVIYYFFLITIAAIFISIFLIKTDITILCRGQIRSSGEPVPIIVPASAIIKHSEIKENIFVYTGDTLLWLDKEKHEIRISHLNHLIDKNSRHLDDLVILLDSGHHSKALKTKLFIRAYEEYRQQISEFETEIGHLQKKHERIIFLYKNQVIPLTEKEESEFQLIRKRKEIELFKKLTRNNWQHLVNEYTQTNQTYKNEVAEIRKETENYFLLTPYSGYIFNFCGVLPGNFVSSGQVVGYIYPTDSLLSEHLIPPKDIGYLKKGMPVIFQVDAYDYHQWGLATGSIIEISQDVYLVDNQPYYKIRCMINERYLELRNGYQGELKNGLTVTARFMVTRRTIAQLFFDKADKWLNPHTQ